MCIPTCCMCAQDRTGRSALHWAAESDHADTVRTLLDFNIDYKAEDCMGRCAGPAQLHARQRRVLRNHSPPRPLLLAEAPAQRSRLIGGTGLSLLAAALWARAGPLCTWPRGQLVQR